MPIRKYAAAETAITLKCWQALRKFLTADDTKKLLLSEDSRTAFRIASNTSGSASRIPITIITAPAILRGVIVFGGAPKNFVISGEIAIVIISAVENISEVFSGVTYLCA